MDKKTFAVGILCLTAVILFVGNLLIPQKADANFVIKDRDYQVITAADQANDEALYILDSRTGQMAIFAYNPNNKGLDLKALKPVMDAFQQK